MVRCYIRRVAVVLEEVTWLVLVALYRGVRGSVGVSLRVLEGLEWMLAKYGYRL